MLASSRFAWYLHPMPKHTTLVDVEYSGGWRQRVPFQLSFADREGGLRGFAASALPQSRTRNPQMRCECSR